MKYHPDDQAEIDRLHAELIAIDEPNNDQVMAFQDASYALGLKRRHGDLRAELDQCGAMADMLLDREWAEHSGTGDISRKLESAITELHNELSESRQREDALQQRLNEADQRIDELRGQVSKLNEEAEFCDKVGQGIEDGLRAKLGEAEQLLREFVGWYQATEDDSRGLLRLIRRADAICQPTKDSPEAKP